MLATVTGEVTGAFAGTYNNYNAGTVAEGKSNTTTAEDDDGILGAWAIGTHVEFAQETAPMFITIIVVNNSAERPFSFELTDYNYNAWNGTNLYSLINEPDEEGNRTYTNMNRVVTYTIKDEGGVPLASGGYAGGQAEVAPLATATIIIQLNITDTGRSINGFDNSFTMTLTNLGANDVYGPGDEPDDGNGEEETGSFVYEDGVLNLSAGTFNFENLPEVETDVANPAFYGFYTSENTLPSERIMWPQTFQGSTTLYAKFGQVSPAIQFDQLWDGTYAISRADGIEYSGDTNFEIPEYYNQKPVTEISSNTFTYFQITHLYIPSTVTTIRYAAIGDMWLGEANGIETIIIPDSVYNIESGALHNTAWLENMLDEEIHTTPGVVYAGKVAYTYRGEFPENGKIELDDYTIGIAEEFMSYNTDLKEIELKDRLKFIGGYAFIGSGLESVVIPSSVETIRYYAFHYNLSLEEIMFEGQPEIIEEGAVTWNPWYTSLLTETAKNQTNSIDIGEINYEYDDGVVYIVTIAYEYRGVLPTLNAEETLLIDADNDPYYDMPANEEIDIKPGTTYIAGWSFAYDSWSSFPVSRQNLIKITIPSTVERIGNSAFSDCINLETVEFLPNSQLKYIDYAAFNKTKISEISIPESFIGFIDQLNYVKAFEDADELSTVYINSETFIQKLTGAEAQGRIIYNPELTLYILNSIQNIPSYITNGETFTYEGTETIEGLIYKKYTK